MQFYVSRTSKKNRSIRKFKSSEPNAGHVTRKIGPLYFTKKITVVLIRQYCVYYESKLNSF